MSNCKQISSKIKTPFGVFLFLNKLNYLSPGLREPWVERITQPIANEIEGQYGDHDGNAGKEHQMRRIEYAVTLFAKHQSPFRGWFFSPETEKRQRGSVQDDHGDS